MYVIIGSAGQLGRDLACEFGADAIALTRHDVDLTDGVALSRVLRQIAPAGVMNAAAFNQVDDAELRPQDAFAVNAFGVRELAIVCRDLECTLLHFGTDYVFGLNGDRTEPYGETDAPGPLGVYGTSKLAGEHFVRAICPRHVVIRTCGLYGRFGTGGKGRNFVNTMLRLGRAGSPVRVVADQRCTPTATADLAAAARQILDAGVVGLLHWTNAGSCTWHEFASEIFRQAGLQTECVPITTAEFGSRAPRPRFSVLSTRRISDLGLPEPRHWTDALREYLAESIGGSTTP